MEQGHRLIYILLAAEGLVSLLTLLAVAFHLRRLWSQKNEDSATEGDPSIRRSVANLSGRLVTFEARLTDFGLRLDTIAAAETRQEHERTKWMHEMQEASMRQLETLRRIDARDAAKTGLINWIRTALEARPCMYNESENGDKSCPDGQPIEGAGKLKPYDPNER